MKVDLPTSGENWDVEVLLDWVKSVESFFEYIQRTKKHQKERRIQYLPKKESWILLLIQPKRAFV